MHRNSLLNALPEAERSRVQQHLEPIVLTRKQVLYDVGRDIEHVYFITEGVASILTFFQDGASVETATVGCEGVVGLPRFLGVGRASERAFMQIEGSGYRMTAAEFDAILKDNPQLRAIMGRFTNAMLRLLSQGSACNRRHSIEQRCARWLLMTQDRAGRNTFDLTQQFLAQMLGVRRATVSTVANAFQKAGCIEYSRGRITVLDRTCLERASCECYQVIQKEFSKVAE